MVLSHQVMFIKSSSNGGKEHQLKIKEKASHGENGVTLKSNQNKRAPWPFPVHNGLPLLPAKKFDPSKAKDAPF